MTGAGLRSMRGRAVVALIICGLGAAASQPSAAEPSRLETILSADSLRVGATGDYRPFSVLDPATGAYSGFDADMARALGEALGVKVVFVPTSWGTLAHDLQSGAFDIAMGGVSITLDRQKIGFFSTPYLRDGKTPIARCADRAKYETLAEIDQPGTRVIVNPGGPNERFDRAHLHQAQIVVASDNRSVFETLAAGRADVMITDATETRVSGEASPRRPVRHSPGKAVLRREKAYWMAPDPALKAFVDQWLHIIAENGTFNSIYSRWLQ